MLKTLRLEKNKKYNTIDGGWLIVKRKNTINVDEWIYETNKFRRRNDTTKNILDLIDKNEYDRFILV